MGPPRKGAKPKQGRAAPKKKLGTKASRRAEREARKPRGMWGFLAAATSVAAVWLASALKVSGKRRTEVSNDRRILNTLASKPMHVTEHAACRMGCRFISQAQVGQVLNSGRINKRKSDVRARPCPKYVVDAEVPGSGDSRKRTTNVSAVFSGCPLETRLITVIDKDTNWECVCD